MKEWKILLSLNDCDFVCDKHTVEEEIPFIPRKGEIFIPSERCVNELNEIVKECYKEGSCKNCKYIHCEKQSEEYIDTSFETDVKEVCYDVDARTVSIYLGNIAMANKQ